MRKLAIFLIIAGFGLSIFLSWGQVNLFAERIDELEFTELQGTWPQGRKLELNQSDNPIRVQFQARYMVDGRLPPVRLPIKVVITDREGTLVSATLSFPTQGIKTGPEQPTVRGSQPVIFNVLNDGEHTIYMTLAAMPENSLTNSPDVDAITATILGNAHDIPEEYRLLGVIIALLGFYLLSRSRRRRKPPYPPKKPKWGRG